MFVTYKRDGVWRCWHDLCHQQHENSQGQQHSDTWGDTYTSVGMRWTEQGWMKRQMEQKHQKQSNSWKCFGQKAPDPQANL